MPFADVRLVRSLSTRALERFQSLFVLRLRLGNVQIAIGKESTLAADATASCGLLFSFAGSSVHGVPAGNFYRDTLTNLLVLPRITLPTFGNTLAKHRHFYSLLDGSLSIYALTHTLTGTLKSWHTT